MNKYTVVYECFPEETIQCLGLFDSLEDAMKYMKSDVRCNIQSIMENFNYSNESDVEIISNYKYTEIPEYGRWRIVKIDPLDF